MKLSDLERSGSVGRTGNASSESLRVLCSSRPAAPWSLQVNRRDLLGGLIDEYDLAAA